jgi:hypothetical protein
MKEMSGLQLVDTSINLARSQLLPYMWLYYIGATPFFLYFLYFFHNMSVNPHAHESLFISSGILAVLLIWMKVWQSIFCFRSLEELTQTNGKLTFKKIIHCTGWQMLIGLTEFFVIPIAIILTIPFGWCYSFLQLASISSLTNSDNIIKHSLEHSRVWQKQNHIMLWILCPVILFTMIALMSAFPIVIKLIAPGTFYSDAGFIVIILMSIFTLLFNPLGGFLLINFIIILTLLPKILHFLFGIETTLSMSNALILHPGFLLSAGVLCFLCMDPLVKIAYVVRIYNYKAVGSGHDIIQKINKFMPVIAILLFLPLFKANASESGEGPNQQQIDKAIKSTFQNNTYIWKEKNTISLPDVQLKKPNFFRQLETLINKSFKKIGYWFKSLFKNKKTHDPNQVQAKQKLISPQTETRILVAVLLMIALSALIYLFIQRKHKSSKLIATTDTRPAIPEPLLKTISADDNPPDEWERMAMQSVSEGDIKSAIRYLFLSTVSFVGSHNLINIRKSSSNRDLRRDLQKRFPDRTDFIQEFSIIISMYEYAWYSTSDISEELFNETKQSHIFVKDYINKNAW